MVEKIDTIEVPSWLFEAGNILGSIRNICGYHLLKNNKYDRGIEQNFTGNINGITGELIFAIYLERKGIKYEMSKINGFGQKWDGDFKFQLSNGTIATIDIKSAMDDNGAININVEAHAKKKVDFYGIVIFNNANADIFILKYPTVETWQSKTSFTNYYSKPISYFKKIKQQHHEKN